MKEVYVYDLEVWQNFHSGTFLNVVTGEVKHFIIFNKRNQLREYIEFLETHVSGLIGFNNVGYDYPIIHFILKNKNRLLRLSEYEITEEIYSLSKRLVGGEKVYFKTNEILIPQLDLYLIWHFNNKNKRTSLKYVEINTRFENVEDLPFDENYFINEEDIDKILEYNLNDVKATEHFYKLSKEDIEMRKELRKQFGFDISFLNFNDPKIGEEIFVKELAKELNISIWEMRNKSSEKPDIIRLKDVILDKIKFEHPAFQKVLNNFKSSVITTTENPFEFYGYYKDFRIDYGVGGVHGCIFPGIYKSSEDKIIIDVDIDGMYPKTSIVNKFYPRQFGVKFCEVYEKMYNTRMAAKRQLKVDKTDKVASAINSGFKLALNGVYGKSNDEYSPLYDPIFTMQITVNGQLLISMLIEQVGNIESLEFLQVNTDGITVRLNKSDVGRFNEICSMWEKYTGYTLEHATYKQMIIRDVDYLRLNLVNCWKAKHQVILDICQSAAKLN